MDGGKREEASGSSSSAAAVNSERIGVENTKVTDTEGSGKVLNEENFGGEEDDEADHNKFVKFVPSPLVPLKEHLDKDKDDESLRRWKEKLLGGVEGDLNGQVEPEVAFQSIGIMSADFGEIITPLPIQSKRRDVLFTLKEGSEFLLKLTFTVKHNIVSGLAYTNTVWKAGIQVDQSQGMLGTFAPQREPYVHVLEEETAPSGVLARGIYSAKLKFADDDKRCHMELDYNFEIKKSS